MRVNGLRFIAIIGTAIISMGFCTAPLYAADNILRLTTHVLEPYGAYTNVSTPKHIADDSFRGLAVDRVRCALNLMEQPYEIYTVPWARAQHMVQTNEADGFFAASQNQERDNYAQLSATIADQKWQWFLLKDTPYSPDTEAFKETATFGGFIGANMLNWLEENQYNVVLRARDTESLLQALLKKRVDVILANNHVMQSLITKMKLADKLQVHTLKNKPLGVYFSKLYLAKRPEFLKKFNESIQNCAQKIEHQ